VSRITTQRWRRLSESTYARAIDQTASLRCSTAHEADALNVRMDSGQSESPHKGKTGLRRIWNAMFYSVEGLRAAYRHEDAFRQEALLALLLIPLALFLPVAGLGKALMIASVLLVLIVELLNSAIEATVDRVSLEHHRLAKRAKDIGSAAVMMSLANVIAVWLLVLFG
jgi:diacylglycerol kinase (ATP)